jgi:hypothetical protein
MRHEEGGSHAMLVEQPAQVGQNLAGGPFNVDRETNRVRVEACGPFEIAGHSRARATPQDKPLPSISARSAKINASAGAWQQSCLAVKA